VFRPGPLVICLLAILLSNVAVAQAGPSGKERQTGADSPPLLSQAIEDYALQLLRLARARPGQPWDLSQGSSRIHVATCQSKKKGILIGAAIGATAGATTAVYVVRGVGGILGASNGASKYITYWTIGGAGAGALGGLAYCR